MERNSSDFDFYGASTHEWIGTVLPYASQKNQIDGNAGFGYRYRVAIMGNHPDNESIADEQIVFALTALGVSDGSGAANRQKKPAISQGDVVMGKFLDGDRRQTPIITNILGRTEGTVYGTGRFDVKTGFVGPVKSANLLDNQESSEAHGIGTPSARIENTKSKRESPLEQLKKSGIPIEPTLGAIPKPPALGSLLNKASGQLSGALPGGLGGALTGGLGGALGEATSQLNQNMGALTGGLDGALGQLNQNMGALTGGLDGALNEVTSQLNQNMGALTEGLDGAISEATSQLNENIGTLSGQITSSADAFTEAVSGGGGGHPVPTDFGMPMDHHG